MTSPTNHIPIAEVFTSIHGEGFWAGTPMTFIRLAGCTVGRTAITRARFDNVVDKLVVLPTGHNASICTTFDGREFPCDTDYSLTAQMTVEKVVSLIPPHIKHICITGGEPLMHAERLKFLVERLVHEGFTIHFETSGTIDPPREWKSTGSIWWACSPKKDYLPLFVKILADEIRIMVDEHLDHTSVEKLLEGVDPSTNIYFCPISLPDNVLGFNPASMTRCLQMVEKWPGTRISIQMHKVLGVR